jgi:hypothetical protein
MSNNSLYTDSAGENKNSTQPHEKNEKEIKESLEKILSLYFKEFLNKFDNFNNQLKFADVLLNAYHYRYQKLRQKFANVGDILSSNYEDQVEFFQKLEKLERLDAKMTQVEIKLQTLNTRIEKFEENVDKISKNAETKN